VKSGAEILIHDCASVRRGEAVLVVTDAERRSIGSALRAVAREAGAETTLVISAPRSIDNEEPEPTVAAAMRSAQVVFMPVSHSLAHTRATRDAISKGARVLSMAAFTEDQMRTGGLFTDFRERKPVCDAIATRFTDARFIRVTNPAGTELTLSIEDRAGNSHSCVLEGPGFTAVPNIEANIAPNEGSAEGILVADGSIPYYGIGVLDEPIRFEISAGSVRLIEGGKQADFVSRLLASQNDPNVYNIAQFAIGLNPMCTELNGVMLNDEGVNGTIHIGIGTSANLGGEIRATTHFDAIIRQPSVWLDDEPILQAGELARISQRIAAARAQ